MFTTIITTLYFASLFFSHQPMQYRPNIDAYATRPDACRTYNIGGYDATDGISCGQGEQVKRENETDETIVIPTNNEVAHPVVVIIVPDDTNEENNNDCDDNTTCKTLEDRIEEIESNHENMERKERPVDLERDEVQGNTGESTDSTPHNEVCVTTDEDGHIVSVEYK